MAHSGDYFDASSPELWTRVPGDVSTVGDCYSLDLEGVEGARESVEKIQARPRGKLFYWCGDNSRNMLQNIRVTRTKTPLSFLV